MHKSSPVEVAGRAVALVHNRIRLQPIGQDDVGVHGGHVQVVDDGRLQPARAVAQLGQLGDDLVAHLVQVEDHGEVDVLLDDEGALHCALHVVDECLYGLGGLYREEKGKNITIKYSFIHSNFDYYSLIIKN